MLAEVEAGRTDEVADVLDEQQVEPVELHIVQCRVDHVGIEVTRAAGTDLHGGYALRPDAYGIVFRLEIAFDDADPEFRTERLDRRFQQRRLAGPGRGHQVHGEHAVTVEVFTVVSRLVVVRVQQPLQHFDGFAAARGVGKVSAMRHEVFVARRHVAAAGITHVVPPPPPYFRGQRAPAEVHRRTAPSYASRRNAGKPGDSRWHPTPGRNSCSAHGSALV